MCVVLVCVACIGACPFVFYVVAFVLVGLVLFGLVCWDWCVWGVCFVFVL